MPAPDAAAAPRTSDRDELEAIRRRLVIDSIRSTTKAGSGHPSTCMSASHLVTALYFGGVLRYDPARPDWPERDRFVLSKGHAAPILYAALIEAGVIDDDILRLREIGSPLEGHPNARRLPGVEASTGSLGQGLSIGLGMALGARLDGHDGRVYVMLGDGEIDEGQVWEAAMAASKYGLGRLVAIVDRNGFQQTGAADEVMPTSPIGPKWEAFGWRAREIDGHDWDQVMDAYDWARDTDGRPSVVVARTVKGYGVRLIEQDPGNKFHGVPLSAEQAADAIREVQGA